MWSGYPTQGKLSQHTSEISHSHAHYCSVPNHQAVEPAWMASMNGSRNVMSTHSGVLFKYKGEGRYFIFRKVGGTEESHVKRNKPDLER